MTKLEDVARAIYAQHPNMAEVWEDLTTSSPPYRRKVLKVLPWEDAEDRHKDCFAQAHAAIEALMEPNEAMVAAGKDGLEAASELGAPIFDGDVVEIWQAMLKAAMEE